jgi:hypothetical protein
MRRTDLDERQVAQRQAVVDALTRAGWSAGALPYNDAFEAGRWASYEAGLQYRNRCGIELSLHYSAAHQKLHLAIRDAEHGQIGLVIELDDREQEILDQLVAAQDDISADDYKDAIRGLIQAAPAVYAVVGEDEDGADVLARLEV